MSPEPSNSSKHTRYSSAFICGKSEIAINLICYQQDGIGLIFRIPLMSRRWGNLLICYFGLKDLGKISSCTFSEPTFVYCSSDLVERNFFSLICCPLMVDIMNTQQTLPFKIFKGNVAKGTSDACSRHSNHMIGTCSFLIDRFFNIKTHIRHDLNSS